MTFINHFAQCLWIPSLEALCLTLHILLIYMPAFGLSICNGERGNVSSWDDCGFSVTFYAAGSKCVKTGFSDTENTHHCPNNVISFQLYRWPTALPEGSWAGLELHIRVEVWPHKDSLTQQDPLQGGGLFSLRVKNFSGIWYPLIPAKYF